VQSAKAVSLIQEEITIHNARLAQEVRLLDDKAESTAYETDATQLQLENRVWQLEEELQLVQEKWKQDVYDLAVAAATELTAERERLKESATIKIQKLQDSLNASEAMYTAEKAEKEMLAADLEKAKDPWTYARNACEAEEEADLLARRKAKAGQLIKHPTESNAIPICPTTKSTCPVQATSWPGHDGSASGWKGLDVQPESEAIPGSQIGILLLATNESPTEAEAAPMNFQRNGSPSETTPMEQQEEKQTQPKEPPGCSRAALDHPQDDLQEQIGNNPQDDPQGAAERPADLQVATEPLTYEEDGAETTESWSICGADVQWVEIPELSECPESNDGEPTFYLYISNRQARGISNIFTFSWESFIFKHPSLELVRSNPSRTCFSNCSTGICRYGAAHQLAETHVRVQEMVTTKRLRSKHI